MAAVVVVSKCLRLQLQSQISCEIFAVLGLWGDGDGRDCLYDFKAYPHLFSSFFCKTFFLTYQLH